MQAFAHGTGASSRRSVARPHLLTAKLCLIELIAWGALYYTFSVFMPAMEHELGMTPAMLAAGFSLALLVSGIAAPFVGAWIDRHGSRGLMVSAAAVGSSGMALWSMAHSQPIYFTAWALIGIGMAGTLYAPAFATVVRADLGTSRNAILIISLVGALASTVFMPLAAMLAELWGWRGALMSIALLLAIVTVPVAATLPGRADTRPDACTARPDMQSTSRASSKFWWLASALMAADAASIAFNVHLVVFLVDQGHSLQAAAGVAGLAGAAKVGGRLATAATRRVSAIVSMRGSLFLQAVTLLLPTVWPSTWAAVVMVVGFGATTGARTVLRPAVVVEMRGAKHFGKSNGWLQLLTTLAKASGPVGFALLLTTLGWTWAWPLLAVIVMISGGLLFGVPPSPDRPSFESRPHPVKNWGMQMLRPIDTVAHHSRNPSTRQPARMKARASKA